MSFETLVVDQSAGAAVITLNRPQVRNAISIRMMEELTSALGEAERMEGCRAAIITGNVDCFSAGRDLKEASQQSQDDALRSRKLWRQLTRTMAELRIPVIAAIEGHCLTGGLELALACDMRIAGDGARFGITSARLGTLPGFGATQRLPRLIGEARALEFLLSAEVMDVSEAYRIGLINRRTPAGNALAEARALAQSYITLAPLSHAAIKLAIARGSSMDLDDALDLEITIGDTLAKTEDRREGISAFLEKRKPVFRGR